MKQLAFTLGAAAILSTSFGEGVLADTYEVKSGDTLWNIASEHQTTVDHLKDLNKLTSDIILPNQVLAVSSNNQKTYIVQKGDTLSKIAEEHGLSVSRLMEWNQLSSDLIFPGDTLSFQAQSHTHGTAATVTSNKPSETIKPQHQSEQSSNKTMTVTATAYTADCNGCTGITATGVNLNENPDVKVIAVDPSVIPLGTKVLVEGYGYAVAADTGSAIKGNKIDIFLPSKHQAIQWGVQKVQVNILE